MARTKGSPNIFKNTYCDICNKHLCIIDMEQYLYKLTIKGKRKYYCSYTCWRKAGGY